MRRRLAILAAIIAPIVATVGCGYPDFMFGTSGTGGAAASSGTTAASASASASGAGGTSTTSSSASSSAASSGGTGGSVPPCSIGHLVISEIRTRGPLPGGANNEFVELFNPTEAPITLDGNWMLDAHTLDANVTSYSPRWTGKGVPIPAHGHFLIVGNGFDDPAPSDDKLAVGLTDAASLRLRHNAANVDVVCYYHATNPGSATGFVLPDPFQYDCEGIAVGNPHDDSNNTNTDTSLERKPGGNAGNCTDSGDNSVDFVAQSPSTPLSTQAPLTP